MSYGQECYERFLYRDSCQGGGNLISLEVLFLYKELCHQLRLAEAAGIFQTAKSPQLLDGGKQRIMVVGGGAVNKMLAASGCEHQSRGVGAAKHDAIDACRAMAAAIGAGVIIFVPHNDEGGFLRAPHAGFRDFVYGIAQVVITQLDDAVVKPGRRESAVRIIEKFSV